VKKIPLNAQFYDFSLPASFKQESMAIIPTIRDTKLFRYGVHAYYFLNLQTSKGLRVEIKHPQLIIPGLKKFYRANKLGTKWPSYIHSLFKKYHYNFSFLEQILLLTVPHTVVEIGINEYLISLWGYFGFLTIDLNQKTVTYNLCENEEDEEVFGAGHIYLPESHEHYYMKYSLTESMKKSTNPYHNVPARIIKQNTNTNSTTELWKGDFSDYLHELIISKNQQYLVACELGMFVNEENELIPSKVLILDLKNNKEWTISRFKVAAHAQFDPIDPDVIYFSNHNFQFEHSHLLKLLKNANYTLRFRGPAAIYKYRLTADGPVEEGIFTSKDLFRLTNSHVFTHKGRKILAAMGAPNYIFIVDANDLTEIKSLEVMEKETNQPAYIGTFAPSPEGDNLYIQTQRSFQVIDIESGQPELVQNYLFNHSCSNHMIVTRNTI
jgi:hypothetical protein